MAIDVALWVEGFAKDSFPHWPCPTCTRGRLVASAKSVSVVEPAYSKEARSHPDWEPEWIVERVIAVLKCDNKKCGEVVIVGGTTEHVQEDDDEFGLVLLTHIVPKSVFPAPPIITVPQGVPHRVRQELQLAFQLYWSDLGASASRLRTSVERMLDQFNISRIHIANGKKRFRTLSWRISKFAQQMPEHKDALDALRLVGNLGTHSEVDRPSLLAAYSVYEEALAEIFGKRSKATKQLVKKLIKGKGKLKA